jgi:hypothetical protein
MMESGPALSTPAAAVLFVVAGLSLLPLALAATAALRRRDRGKSAARAPRTWRLVLPREIEFSPVQAAAFFGGLSPLLRKRGTQLAIQLAGEGKELVLRLVAPPGFEETLRGQLAAWFPRARLEPELPAPVLSASGLSQAGRALGLARSCAYPIRAAGRDTSDPLLGVVGALTAGEMRCGISVTLARAPWWWRAWAQAGREALRSGLPMPPSGLRFFFAEFTRALRPGCERRPLSGAAGPVPAAKRLAEVKLASPALSARLTVWAEAESPSRAEAEAQALAHQLETAFHEPEGNALVPTRGRQVPSVLLSTAELGSLFHVPASEHPLVPREPSRKVAPTPGLIRSWRESGPDRTLLGEALAGERRLPFGLAVEERRLHSYVVGKTGTGKSTLLATMIRQDLEAGRGVGLIDPHGDLAEHVLSLVPDTRAGDLLYFNAADTEHPVGFNLLSVGTPASRPLVASGVVGVFKKLYGESWGPRLEHFLRNSILALLESPSPSLLLLPRLLTDRGFRSRLLQHVRDPLLRSFFLEEFEGYDPRWRAEALSPILNKVGQFLASPVVRHIVGQGGPGFDLRELMDGGGIFIANLASGRIGEDNCDLLGGLLVAGFQLAAVSRADQPEEERRDFFLFVDEFQHFANDAFASILSEARKYRLSLTLSHQYLDQVEAAVSDAVFGNAGSLCVFRVGAGDTTRLVKELAPVFDTQDLVHLPNHHFCARLARPTGMATPFSARTIRPNWANGEKLMELVQASRRRWSRRRAEVELEIADIWEGRIY